jgi:hypothetical protein
MPALTALLFLVIGITLGLLGGGGSILTLPVLVSVLHVEPRGAIAMSLLVVGTTSATATVAHARRGGVAWRTGLVMGIAGMAGAYAGGRLTRFVAAEVLLGAFAVIMLVTATLMLRGRRGGAAPEASPPRGAAGRHHSLRVAAAGAAVGVVAGFVGAGGGFLIVPALIFFAGLPMRRAVGTSLFVIALQSFAGLAGHLGHARFDWTLAAVVTAAAAAGSLVGTRIGRRVPADALRRGFAWFVLAMGALFLLQRILAARALAPSLPALVVIALALGCAVAIAAAVVSYRRRSISGDHNHA